MAIPIELSHIPHDALRTREITPRLRRDTRIAKEKMSSWLWLSPCLEAGESTTIEEPFMHLPHELSPSERETYLRFSSLSLPRYTSYPTVPQWDARVDRQASLSQLEKALSDAPAYSLYFHVPFCQQLCFYCACQKEIRSPRSASTILRVGDYLKGLARELDGLKPTLAKGRLAQLHFGGGTPNFLSVSDWRSIVENLLAPLPRAGEIEWSVEIDPRTMRDELLDAFAAWGVQRLSLGVQDFEPAVQQSIHRSQSLERVTSIVKRSREKGIRFINFDLIYGLPLQTTETMARTLEKVIRLKPDRIAFYRLALLPELFKAQKSFKASDMPSAAMSLALREQAHQAFLSSGYEAIGLDHYARSDDPLARAARQAQLQRNFQGMTTGRNLSLVGLGPSAISSYADLYIQNAKTVDAWLQDLEISDKQRKGRILSLDDRIRRSLIDQIFCQGEIDSAAIELAYAIDFKSYFAPEMQALQSLEQEHILLKEGPRLRVNPSLALHRVVASVFDAYLPRNAWQAGMEAGRASQVG